jgi:glycosyltransferase involved in cell wall biosynthesis
MKFSVVTISFNQAEFLERTIRSVLAQTGVDVEYIIVDAGSGDGSRDIIAKYYDRFAQVILEKDDGPADGLNKGFARASGDVYCYLNADDTFEPDALATVAAFITNHPKLDVVCGHGWVTDRFDQRLRRVWSEPYRPCFVAYGASVQIQPSTFIRRDAFLRTRGFNIQNFSNWDGELLLNLHLTDAKIGIVDAFLSTYRLHTVSITNSGRLDTRIQEYRQRLFAQLLGREEQFIDRYIGCIFKALKHVYNIQATIERLRFGPIYRRGE